MRCHFVPCRYSTNREHSPRQAQEKWHRKFGRKKTRFCRRKSRWSIAKRAKRTGTTRVLPAPTAQPCKTATSVSAERRGETKVLSAWISAVVLAALLTSAGALYLVAGCRVWRLWSWSCPRLQQLRAREEEAEAAAVRQEGIRRLVYCTDLYKNVALA